jgi:hypothetical protein
MTSRLNTRVKVADNSGSQSRSLANCIIIFFTAFTLFAAASLYVKNWVGFDLGNFGDAKLYFLSTDEKQTFHGEASYYKTFSNYQLLHNAADSLSDIDSNCVSQVHRMADCYETMYGTMPNLYDKINTYNTCHAIWFTIILVLWAFSLWAVREVFIYRSQQTKVSEQVSQEVGQLRAEVNALKTQKEEKTEKPHNDSPKSNLKNSNGEIFLLYSPFAMSVQLVGNFTNWLEHPINLDKDEDGTWRVKVDLKSGKYHYRFLVNGQWYNDPECAFHESNPYGGENMIRNVM